MSTNTSRRRKRITDQEVPEGSLTKPQIQMVPLEQIEVDDHNPRLEGSTEASRVTELAQSMKAHGQQQPVQVFEYPDELRTQAKSRYLLAFGFRRCAAARLNEWTTVAAIIKPMPLKPDGSVDRLRIDQVRSIENLQRENLTPIEECILIQKLAAGLPQQLEDGNPTHDEHGGLTDAAVKHLGYSIGRTEAWIRDRLYLDRLSPSVKESVLQGKLYLIFGREISKLADHGEQERVASMCQADPKDGHCSISIHQVRRYVAERQNSLRGVPWQLDKEFPKHKLIVGPCSSCPFNSTNDKKLFEHDGSAAPEGHCLRASCFEAKRQLAEKATQVAVAKIVKQELPATEATATEVTADFVKPARVARQAKKQLEGNQPKPEKRKLEYHERPEYKARLALGETERKWREDADHQLTRSLKENPRRLTALMLISQLERMKWNMTEKEVAKLQELFKATIKVKPEFLSQLERLLLKQKGFEFSSVLSISGREPLVAALAQLYGIEMTEFPKLGDFLPSSESGDAPERDI